VELDAADIRILSELQKDSRTSQRGLAEAVGLTSPTVASRIKTLTDSGVISRFTADIPPSSLGQGTVIIRAGASAATALAEMEQVREARMAGPVVLATAVYRSVHELETLLEAVASTGTFTYDIVTSVVKKEPLAIVDGPASAGIRCHLCSQVIAGRPRKAKLGGRDHFFCCPICEREFVAKWDRIMEKA